MKGKKNWSDPLGCCGVRFQLNARISIRTAETRVLTTEINANLQQHCSSPVSCFHHLVIVTFIVFLRRHSRRDGKIRYKNNRIQNIFLFFPQMFCNVFLFFFVLGGGEGWANFFFGRNGERRRWKFL